MTIREADKIVGKFEKMGETLDKAREHDIYYPPIVRKSLGLKMP
jgi:hypothetical protein